MTQTRIEPTSRPKLRAVIDDWLDRAEATPLHPGECHFITLRVTLDSGWVSERGLAIHHRPVALGQSTYPPDPQPAEPGLSGRLPVIGPTEECMAKNCSLPRGTGHLFCTGHAWLCPT